MSRLYVDKNGIVKEFTNLFLKNLQLAEKAFKADIESRTSSSLIGIKQKPEVYVELNKQVNLVSIRVSSNIAFLLDNYGTGSLMSTDNPGLNSYKNSDLWNPLRTSNTIVGRKKGTYKNITGTHTTSGKYAGANLEGRTVKLTKASNKITFKPIPPTNALHIAISWFYKDWFPECWAKTKNEFNYSKFLTFK